MGTAHVSFRMLLRDAVYAPSVMIGCDEKTLEFRPDFMSPLPDYPILAGRQGEVEVSAILVDRYSNRGALRKVAWFTTHGEIRPSETFTDKDGISRVWISSLSPGEARIAVADENGAKTWWTDPVVFADKPRIVDQPRVISVAMVGQPLVVRSLVAGLDDAPVPAEPVVWWTSADATKVTQNSDAEGYSWFSVDAVQPGELTIYAQLDKDPVVEVTVWVASDAVIHSYSESTQFPVVGARPTLLWVDVKESMDPAAKPLANYPVQWSLSPGSTVSILTDEQGRSVYPFEPVLAGDFELTATLAHNLEHTRNFNLTVLRELKWKVTLVTIAESGEEAREVIPVGDELQLFRGKRYRLEILPDTAAQLAGHEGRLGWSSDYTSQALEMKFTPPLATPVKFVEGEPWTVDIDIGDRRDGVFQLNLSCALLGEVLVLQGSLKKRPSALRAPQKTRSRIV